MNGPLFDAHEHLYSLPEFAEWNWDLHTMASYVTTPFAAFGYAIQAHEGITSVLEHRIGGGEMGIEFTKQVARCIMFENDLEFQDLRGSSAVTSNSDIPQDKTRPEILMRTFLV